MNEIDLVAAVLVSSGAGWYAGHYYERRKARAAFQSFSFQAMTNAMESTGKLMNAAISLMQKKLPGADPDQLAQELVEEGNRFGMECKVVSKAERDALIKGAMNGRKH